MTFPESMMCTGCLNLTPVRATEERPNLGTSLNTTWSHREYENVLTGKKQNKNYQPRVWQKTEHCCCTNRANRKQDEVEESSRQNHETQLCFVAFPINGKKKSKDKKVAISHVKQKTISKDRCHVTLMWPQMNYEL